MVEFNNRTDYELPIDRFAELARKAAPEKEELSVAFLPADEIADLNSRYRKKKDPTDVLSFKAGPGLGEVLICPQVVKEEFGDDFLNRMDRVLVHGILHLLGYDHQNDEQEARMKKKEDEILSG